MKVPVRSDFVAAFLLATLTMASPEAAVAGCGEECDAQYSSEIDDCRTQYGDDPDDADDLVNCIQEARDNYRGCLDDCPSASLSLPRWRELVSYRYAVCLNPQNGARVLWQVRKPRLPPVLMTAPVP
jgi:hypothetical protein